MKDRVLVIIFTDDRYSEGLNNLLMAHSGWIRV